MIKDEIFPTEIFIVGDVLSKDEIENIKEDIYGYDTRRPNWQSMPDLHTQPTYSNLVKKINESIQSILGDHKHYAFDGFHITGMWATLLKKNEMHQPHTHSNNLFSGVFYVQSDVNSNIQFSDPRPQARVLEPYIHKFTKGNSSSWWYPSLENTMIIFPSWLQHYVPVNPTTDRISISFNIMLKGKFGEHLQQATF